MIEEESAAKKKRNEMERMRREMGNILSIGTENDGEVDTLKESHSPADGVGTQDAAEEATDPTDSFHPKEECITSVQEAGMQLLTSMELDDEAEVETENDVKSSKEMDVEAEDGSTGQGTGHYFKKKESGEESGEKDEVEAAKKNNRQEYASG